MVQEMWISFWGPELGLVVVFLLFTGVSVLLIVLGTWALARVERAREGA